MISAFGVDHGESYLIRKDVSRRKENAVTGGLVGAGGVGLGVGAAHLQRAGKQAEGGRDMDKLAAGWKAKARKAHKAGDHPLGTSFSAKSGAAAEHAQKFYKVSRGIKGSAAIAGALGTGALAGAAANHSYVNQDHRQWRRK